jgi:3-phenylpropionate/cinnamic acid dioxygenase small subunit
MTTIDLELRARVEAFLIHETALLDERRYAEWIELFTPDGVYWVPANRDDTDPKTHVSLVYDNVARLRERLVRADSGMFWAQDPPTRATRVIGNLSLAPDGTDLLASCRLVLVTQRRG